MNTFNLIPVESTGKEIQLVHYDRADRTGRTEWRPVEVWPRNEKAERFRLVRLGLCMTVRGAAGILGLTAFELSGLEVGRLNLSDADWAKAEAALTNFRNAMAGGDAPLSPDSKRAMDDRRPPTPPKSKQREWA